MNLFQRLTRPTDFTPKERQMVELMSTMNGQKVETISENFQGFVTRAYHDNGIIWAAVLARLILFSQARLVLRDVSTNELSDLPPRLRYLDVPWPNGTAGELLARVEQDTSLAGNYYIHRAEPQRLQRLRPDWVDIITNGREPIQYAYYVGGDRDKRPRLLDVKDVAHGSPYPDPVKAFVGNSWVTSIVKDVMSDQAMNSHKLKFFENAATPNLLIKLQQTLNTDQKTALQAALEARHQGFQNAWKTMVLEGGADAQVIGSQFEQMAFDTVQSAGENRIAVASRVPSVVLGIKEGANIATYSNYGQAVRAFADHTIRHLWMHLAGVLGQIVDVPAGKELWYDDRAIPALQADAQDEASIRQTDAISIRQLLDAGFNPDTVVDAVVNGDLAALKGNHTGLFSVQLQEPGQEETEEDAAPVIEPESGDTDERFDSIISNLKDS